MTISGFRPCGGGSDGKASDTERKENNSSCFLMLLELGTDHYFLRMVVVVVVVALKKNSARGTVGKNRARAFKYRGPIFEVKKVIAQVTAHERKNHAEPKCEKKCACPRKSHFRKFKVALNLTYRIFLNFAKSCVMLMKR